MAPSKDAAPPADAAGLGLSSADLSSALGLLLEAALYSIGPARVTDLSGAVRGQTRANPRFDPFEIRSWHRAKDRDQARTGRGCRPEIIKICERARHSDLAGFH